MENIKIGNVNRLASLIIAFLKARLGLLLVILIWGSLYAYDNFFRASDSSSILLMLFYVPCFIVSILSIIANLVRRRFKLSNSSVIIMALLLLSAFIVRFGINMEARVALYAYFAPDTCKAPKSQYLNENGIRLCYSYADYPFGQFIIKSPNLDFSRNKLSVKTINEFSCEEFPFNWLHSNADIKKSLINGSYYMVRGRDNY